jgi:hypothetical protein
MREVDPEDFKWELSIFRIDSCNNWLSFGFPILGGWLPWVAFKSVVEYDKIKEYTVQYVFAEWFIRGYMVVYKVKEEELEDNG